MDMHEFRRAHPKLFADLEAAAASIATQRARSTARAHLELGRLGGQAGLRYALKCIAEGTEVRAHAGVYTEHVRRHQEMTARQDECDALADILDGANQETIKQDLGEQVADLMLQRRGQ